MKVIGWRIWVDGGIICDSRDIGWADVANDGIIFMVTYKEGGYREMFSGHDHYFKAPHAEGTIYGLSDDSINEIKRRYPGAVVKLGKWVPSETMVRIQREAANYKWSLDGDLDL